MAEMINNSVWTIDETADALRECIEEQLRCHLPSRQDEFQARFDEVGDMAYGALNTELFAPARTLLREAGLKAAPRLPGSFQRSREWGNADETHQQRWFWSIITRIEGDPIGAIAVGSHHDHRQFRLPRNPEIIALRAHKPSAIIRELSEQLPEFGKAQEFKEWYSNYIAS